MRPPTSHPFPFPHGLSALIGPKQGGKFPENRIGRLSTIMSAESRGLLVTLSHSKAFPTTISSSFLSLSPLPFLLLLLSRELKTQSKSRAGVFPFLKQHRTSPGKKPGSHASGQTIPQSGQRIWAALCGLQHDNTTAPVNASPNHGAHRGG